MIRARLARHAAERGARECDPPRGARGRSGSPLPLLVALAALAAAPPSRADGDPASDYLLTQNVFLPYQSPSPGATAALEQAVDAVYAHGRPRQGRADLRPLRISGRSRRSSGSPADYAQFLGIELSFWYKGPLLVVMPSGFGIYDGGRSTAAAEQVLASIPLAAASPDDLAQSRRQRRSTALEAAGALDSPDITPPLVTAYPAVRHAGQARDASLRRLRRQRPQQRRRPRLRAGRAARDPHQPRCASRSARAAVAVHWPVPAQAPEPAAAASASSRPTRAGTAAASLRRLPPRQLTQDRVTCSRPSLTDHATVFGVSMASRIAAVGRDRPEVTCCRSSSIALRTRAAPPPRP